MLLDAIQLRLEEQFDRQGISHNGLFIDFTFSPGKSVYELVVDLNAADREAMVDALAHNLAALRDSGITNAEYQALVEQYAANVQFDDIQFRWMWLKSGQRSVFQPFATEPDPT